MPNRATLREFYQGAIRLSVGSKDGVIVVEFGKSLRWFALDIETAQSLVASLEKHIKAVKEGMN